jgi:hypothetical protein
MSRRMLSIQLKVQVLSHPALPNKSGESTFGIGPLGAKRVLAKEKVGAERWIAVSLSVRGWRIQEC